jgi:hypothetical protein
MRASQRAEQPRPLRLHRQVRVPEDRPPQQHQHVDHVAVAEPGVVAADAEAEQHQRLNRPVNQTS